MSHFLSKPIVLFFLSAVVIVPQLGKEEHFSSGCPIYCTLRIDAKLLALFGHLKGSKIILTFSVLL